MTNRRPRRQLLRALGTLPLVLLAAGCGFRLRGTQDLPFKTLHVTGGDPVFLIELKRAITAGTATRLVDDPKTAEAVLYIDGVARERHILSLSGAGRVRELELRLRVQFHMNDAQGQPFIAPSQISLKRDLTYDDTQVLAKEQEEALLYRDMQNDAIQQIMFRLAAVRRRTG
ncbi:MAG: hypothetical protein DI596_01400 [Azospira oryzae]|nr:MAG: hypothetical protein DI596_01400 [Azospira oryzae]PZP82629.1 MAG: hypothetical protein DI593_01400 [Azospira oryzae]